METKICTKCGEEKPLDGYYKHNGCKHGVASECKRCIKYKNDRKLNKKYCIIPLQNKNIMMFRSCSKCRILKPIYEFHSNGSWCAECSSQWKKEHYQNNPDAHSRKKSQDRERYKRNLNNDPELNKKQYKKTGIKYLKNNRDRIAQYLKERRKKYPELFKGYGKKQHRRITDNLTDSYIKSKLRNSGVKKEQVTPEIIEQRRAIIQIKRTIKKLKQNATS